jgi:hypothetical protein
MLSAGFFACGCQLAFIATHLPAWLLERGMGGRHAAIALSLAALHWPLSEAPATMSLRPA